MSNLVRFEKVDNELNILRIGGKSWEYPKVCVNLQTDVR